MALFVLVKRKGAKKFLGAFRSRKGTTRKQLMVLVKKQKRVGFDARIVTEMQLRKILKRVLPKKVKQILAKKLKQRRKKR